MKELLEYLNGCEDNRFFYHEIYSDLGYNVEISDFINDEDEAEKICEQLNELLLRVKRGELGKGDDSRGGMPRG